VSANSIGWRRGISFQHGPDGCGAIARNDIAIRPGHCVSSERGMRLAVWICITCLAGQSCPGSLLQTTGGRSLVAGLQNFRLQQFPEKHLQPGPRANAAALRSGGFIDGVLHSQSHVTSP
jgi:hypothetical protein